MVGESAHATAEPQSETAGRLIESSARWIPGGRRESITASELHAVEQVGFTVLNDVKWPGKRFGKIDHVVIGGGQVWVVSAKKWVGSVTVTGGVLKENGRSRQKYVAEVAEQTQAIASLSPMLPRATFHPILCVEKDEWVNERFGDVWICSSINLVAVVETPPEKGPDYLHNDLVRQLEEALRDQAAPAPPVQLHPEAPPEVEAPKVSWRARRAYLKNHKTTAPSGDGTSAGKSRRGLAVLAVAGLAIASVLFFKPDLITEPAGSVTDSITGVFFPDEPDPAPPAEDKPKKNGNKNKNKQQQQEQQQPEQQPTG
jgi:Nuclease-related domain